MTVDHMIVEWAAELAQHLGRSEAEIRDRGLSAHDFPISQSVEIRYADKSHMDFHHAFALIGKERQLVAVFTEHCGYFVFPLLPDMKVIHSRRDVYFHEP